MAQEPSRSWVYGGRAPSEVARTVDAYYLADERETVRFLLEHACVAKSTSEQIKRTAHRLIEAIRERQRAQTGLDAFLSEYDLSSSEGIVLMCLAEALLRIPDAETADRLIADKLSEADWEAHLGSSRSLFVNASTWALMLTGRIMRPEDAEQAPPSALFGRLAERLGESVVRAALRQAMRILGHQFVMGRTMEEALRRAARAPAYSYSFDMLGEAAMTANDARRYFDSYAAAIDALARLEKTTDDPLEAPGISVKLSALYPRYEVTQRERAVPALAKRLAELALAARDAGVGVTVDAEEADRLELSLAIFERVFKMKRLAGYCGLGLAVQAYQKRAWHVLQWLEELGHSCRRVIPVRLVKGAYWDTEIKRAQEQGLDDYPVFTRKTNTDVSYLACAKLLLQSSPHLFPQFATHNAHTVAWILEVGAHERFEFQRLHGMGEELYGELNRSERLHRPCRVYAPVGSHQDLLPYLVRRLLENGANTSFVNRLVHAQAPIEEIIADPVETARAFGSAVRHPKIPLPRNLFGDERLNSRGWNLADRNEMRELAAALEQASRVSWHAAPRIEGELRRGEARECRDPSDRRRLLGTAELSDADTAALAFEAADAFQESWNRVSAKVRAGHLRRAADLYEAHTAELVARCVREAGRTIPDSLAEVREAVDFLRYYAAQSERLFDSPVELAGPTGERNELRLLGRGVFLCISPWNFPLSIFTGQVAAALAAGNTVLAKPAEQTSLVAARAVELLLEAGIPPAALQFLPGDGATVAEAVLPRPRLAGVAFTGSVETAQIINRSLARREGPLATLIAETGGVNAMIVDSSALPEQVVRDSVASAFNSAGQRCSALRLLCLQRETADKVLEMLAGHMDELVIGDPGLLATDLGPVIDDDSRRALADYVSSRRGQILHECPLDESHANGLFFPPTLIELDDPRDLDREVFGPVLHVVRYEERRLHALVDAINATGFGLTLGVHTRVDSLARDVADRARVGNVYVNRNMIGAQVGVQPFGGMGLSGTGPKAGGPHYLPRFATEQTLTINTAAVGGNATLLTMSENDRSS